MPSCPALRSCSGLPLTPTHRHRCSFSRSPAPSTSPSLLDLSPQPTHSIISPILEMKSPVSRPATTPFISFPFQPNFSKYLSALATSNSSSQFSLKPSPVQFPLPPCSTDMPRVTFRVLGLKVHAQSWSYLPSQPHLTQSPTLCSLHHCLH